MQRYTKRPVSFEHVTLADWAAWYDSCGKPYTKQFVKDTDNFPLETANNSENDDELCDGSITCNKKNKRR